MPLTPTLRVYGEARGLAIDSCAPRTPIILLVSHSVSPWWHFIVCMDIWWGAKKTPRQEAAFGMLSSRGLYTLLASVQILHPSQVWETREDCCVSGM